MENIKKDLLSINDLAIEEMQIVFRRADDLRKEPGRYESLLKGKVLAMIFEKPSTRTRLSFEVAMEQLGGKAICMNSSDMQMSRGESLRDTAKVMERYTNGIMARVFKHSTLLELAAHTRNPVINGLSEKEHPCQVLGDMYTIRQKKRALKGLKFAYIGDAGANVASSLILACTKLGMDIYVASPKGYEPRPEIMRIAEQHSRKFWGTFKVVPHPKQAATNADIVYTDTWVSMGDESQARSREKALAGYQVNPELLSLAKKDCLFMHCLPAHRGKEVADQVMDGPNSVVFEQAENRLHVQKSILTLLLREPPKQEFRPFY